MSEEEATEPEPSGNPDPPSPWIPDPPQVEDPGDLSDRPEMDGITGDQGEWHPAALKACNDEGDGTT